MDMHARVENAMNIAIGDWRRRGSFTAATAEKAVTAFRLDNGNIFATAIGLIPNPECSRVGPEEWVIQASLRKLNVLAAQLVQAEPIVISAADSSYW